MDIFEIDKLQLFIIAVIPGFISIKAYQLFFPSIVKDAKDMLIDAVTYSCINYALLALPLYLVNIYQEKLSIFDIWLAFILAIFVFPVLWVFIWKKIRETQWAQKNSPHPIAKPWDYVFSKGRSYWIKVTLTNGKIIAGRYSTESFASSSPSPEQIYIEEVWKIDDDGAFIRQVNDSEGILILCDQISTIEFRKYQG